MPVIPFRTPPAWTTRLGTLDQVMAAIAKTEAAKSVLNNPGNLIYVGQPGASPSSNCFTDTNTGKLDCIAQFDTLSNGIQAEQGLIQQAANSGLTIQQFTNRYAPAGSGNNPAAYAQIIANATGLSVSDPLSAAIAAPPADSGSTPIYGPFLPPTDPGVVSPACDPSDPSCASYAPPADDTAAAGASMNWGVVGIALGAAVLLALALD